MVRDILQDQIDRLGTSLTKAEEKVAELHLQSVRLQASVDAMARQQDELYEALMHPQPGQEKSLLARMANVTLDIESGKRTAKMLIAFATTLAALGAAVKFGIFAGWAK